MRKITVIVLIILILSFTGCSQNAKKEYVNLEKYETSLTEASTNGATDENIVTEETYLGGKRIWIKTYKGLENEKKTVTHKGEEIELRLMSYLVYPTYTVLEYWNKETTLEFAYREDTGEIVMYDASTTPEIKESKLNGVDIENPKENALCMAEKYAAQLVSNYKEYDLFTSETDKSFENENGEMVEYKQYRVNFSKKVAGLSANDSFWFIFDSRGNLLFFNALDIGGFDGIEIKYDDSKLVKSIENKVKDIYAGSDREILDWEITGKRIVKTPEGVYISFGVVVKFKVSASEYESKTGFFGATLIGVFE